MYPEALHHALVLKVIVANLHHTVLSAFGLEEGRTVLFNDNVYSEYPALLAVVAVAELPEQLDAVVALSAVNADLTFPIVILLEVLPPAVIVKEASAEAVAAVNVPDGLLSRLVAIPADVAVPAVSACPALLTLIPLIVFSLYSHSSPAGIRNQLLDVRTKKSPTLQAILLYLPLAPTI